ERLVSISSVQPLQRIIRDYIRHIPICPVALAMTDHFRIIVIPLVRQNIPIVKSGWIAFRPMTQMPFTDNGCLIPIFLQQFRKCLLAAIEIIVQTTYTVYMTVISG